MTLGGSRAVSQGFSGGNLERPGLERLLSNVEAGRIDCVVVYKVDRLSRSLLDFARLIAERNPARVRTSRAGLWVQVQMAAARAYFFSPFANVGPGTNSPVLERVTSPRLSKNVRRPPALLGPNPVFLLISVI